MNPFVFAKRRPMTALLLLLGALIAGGVVGLEKMGVPVRERVRRLRDTVDGRFESHFHAPAAEPHHEAHKVVVTSPVAKDIVITQEYVCQIHSQQHIMVRSLESGYLGEILVKEGQAVKKGDLLFKIVSTLYQSKLDAETAEARLAQLELNNTKKLAEQKVVSQNEVLLLDAKLAKAQAKASLARAELNFTNVVAPFDGIVDRRYEQLGSLIKEGDVLTTLSDNSAMWVYFNVPERRYLEYMADVGRNKESQEFELELADHSKFPHIGKYGTVEAKFNSETGNLLFRADFPNPERLLRHGQTGKVLIRRPLKDAVVIPQRATFENLAKQYVFVVGKDDVVHQREITVKNELDDIYVIKDGVGVDDKIVLEGIRQVHDGEKVEYEFRQPELVLADQKNKAE